MLCDSVLQAVLDKADVVLLMDEELKLQGQAGTSVAAEPSDAGLSDSTGATISEQQQQQPGATKKLEQQAGAAGAVPAAAAAEAAAAAGMQAQAMRRSDTGLSVASSTASTAAMAAPALSRAEPGSGGSMPSPLTSLASDLDSPTASAAAAVAAAPSLYVSAAASVQLEGSGSCDVDDVAVLLEQASDGAVQLSILLPAAKEQQGGEQQEQGGAGAEEASDGELPPELAGGCAACERVLLALLPVWNPGSGLLCCTSTGQMGRYQAVQLRIGTQAVPQQYNWWPGPGSAGVPLCLCACVLNNHTVCNLCVPQVMTWLL
jgi:hypothetical protein